jgi:hypothetical protein
MKRKDFEHEMQKLHGDLALKKKELITIQDAISDLRRKEESVLEEHAVIPKQFKTIEEWLEGHPYPDSLNHMRCESYAQAFSVWCCCNTYYFNYHIVKTGNS